MRKRIWATILSTATVLLAFAMMPVSALAESVGAVSMYRLYNPNTGEHFYTAATAERDTLSSVGWRYEGVGWRAPEKSDTPVYRLYNSHVIGGDHHYTMSASERDMLVRAGWKYEGVGWYSDDGEAVPVYREYNPNATTGTHNYTKSESEHRSLVRAGWRDEGVAWYGVSDLVGTWQGRLTGVATYGGSEDCFGGRVAPMTITFKSHDTVTNTARVDMSFIVHNHDKNVHTADSTSGDQLIELHDVLVSKDSPLFDFRFTYRDHIGSGFLFDDPGESDEYTAMVFTGGETGLNAKIYTSNVFFTYSRVDTYQLVRVS